MNNNITVWTKQHENVLKVLERDGRYVAKKEYIYIGLDEHADLVLEAYDWLVRNTPNADTRPIDAEYPVWVSLDEETTMLPSDDCVILELSIDKDILTKINIDKWGTILNYSYIPADEKDKKEHSELLKQYGTSDAQAYMSQFYPDIKRKVVNSWIRLFDDDIILSNDNCYGNIWEVKKEWVKKVII